MSNAFLHPTRRAFVRNGTLVLLAAGNSTLWADATARRLVRVGLVTDLHYADKFPNGTRHYRHTLAKLSEAAAQFTLDKPDFTVELGDFIDAADSVEAEQNYLATVNDIFATIPGAKYYVLGNHCVDMLTKAEFLEGVGQKESYYSFDRGGVHFIVLDACFRADGRPYGRKNSKWDDANIPAEELVWLEADLKSTQNKVIVLAHQRLDEGKQHAVKNAAAVRKLLEASSNVLAVFQGHSHQNNHQLIDGIHYCTLHAMVEGAGDANNGYSVMDIDSDHTIRISGFRKQAAYEWGKG